MSNDLLNLEPNVNPDNYESKVHPAPSETKIPAWARSTRPPIVPETDNRTPSTADGGGVTNNPAGATPPRRGGHASAANGATPADGGNPPDGSNPPPNNGGNSPAEASPSPITPEGGGWFSLNSAFGGAITAERHSRKVSTGAKLLQIAAPMVTVANIYLASKGWDPAIGIPFIDIVGEGQDAEIGHVDADDSSTASTEALESSENADDSSEAATTATTEGAATDDAATDDGEEAAASTTQATDAANSMGDGDTARTTEPANSMGDDDEASSRQPSSSMGDGDTARTTEPAYSMGDTNADTGASDIASPDSDAADADVRKIFEDPNDPSTEPATDEGDPSLAGDAEDDVLPELDGLSGDTFTITGLDTERLELENIWQDQFDLTDDEANKLQLVLNDRYFNWFETNELLQEGAKGSEAGDWGFIEGGHEEFEIPEEMADDILALTDPENPGAIEDTFNTMAERENGDGTGAGGDPQGTPNPEKPPATEATFDEIPADDALTADDSLDAAVQNGVEDAIEHNFDLTDEEAASKYADVFTNPDHQADITKLVELGELYYGEDGDLRISEPGRLFLGEEIMRDLLDGLSDADTDSLSIDERALMSEGNEMAANGTNREFVDGLDIRVSADFDWSAFWSRFNDLYYGENGMVVGDKRYFSSDYLHSITDAIRGFDNATN